MPTLSHLQLSLNPVLLHLGSLEIRYYGVLLTLSLFLGYLWLIRFHPRGEKTPHLGGVGGFLDFFLLIALAGLFGAKIVYLLLAWLEGSDYLRLTIYNLLNGGGLSFHGGLLGGMLGAWWYATRHRGFSLLKVADHISLYLPIGIILVRCGNFINQELVGYPTQAPWGVVFALKDSTPRHPTPLYEALAAVLIGLTLWAVHRSEARHGRTKGGYLFLWFLLLYSLGRFLTDFFREQTIYSGLSLAQWVSLMLIAACLWLLKSRLTRRP